MFQSRRASGTQRKDATRHRLPGRPPLWRSITVALVTVGIATVCRLWLDPILGAKHPLTLYFAAVAVTAWYGGFGPAMFATAVSYFAADWFFITPRFAFNFPRTNLNELLLLVSFLFSCFAIAITSAIMQRALADAWRKQTELEAEIAERERVEERLKDAQAQLERHTRFLEESVEERTAHLRETIRSLEGVCYHIAHDLRAPLRAMDGFTSILLAEHQEQLDAAAREYLLHISEAAHRMDLLIHGLLEYGRLGHQSFPIKAINTEIVLDHVLQEFAAEIASRKARVTVDKRLPRVMANEQLLELVFTNLISNSLKFVRPGEAPAISVSGESCSGAPDPGYVRLKVSDEGIGIPPEYAARAFWIFERLHPRTDYPGIGIGLAIASKAVERMGGRVGLDSEEGKGACFWFELPMAPAQTAPERESSTMTQAGRAMVMT
ncbi:MAG TPA: ATP-binding protein [Verrucomicrobiae bacterium]|nr:ATP-binding protein [Verrucomicrobiae bacterium]